jgi:hypothetical protein
VLLYKFIEEIPRFFPYVIKSCPLVDLVVPICFYMLEGRAHTAKLGIIYMCTFILLKFSGERQFSIALNEAFEVIILLLLFAIRLYTHCGLSSVEHTC